MGELPVARAAIYTQLAAGTALRALLGGTAIYYQQAPDGAALPYVVFSLQAGGPENETPSDAWNELYYVRGYAQSPSTAGSIDYECNALLHRKSLTVTGYTNFWTARESGITLVETPPSGGQIWSSGALYRVRLDT